MCAALTVVDEGYYAGQEKEKEEEGEGEVEEEDEEELDNHPHIEAFSNVRMSTLRNDLRKSEGRPKRLLETKEAGKTWITGVRERNHRDHMPRTGQSVTP